MELIELNAKTREAKGKSAAKAVRKQNAIPAVIYGAKSEAASLTIDYFEFDKIIRENGSTGLFFNLKIEGGEDRTAMLKEIQQDTFGLSYIHLDLLEIGMDTKVTVTVPVEAVGESAGVKEGGLLQIIRRELDVVCKPADTPDSIQVDVTGLNVGDAVHVEDIDLGDAVEIPHEVNFTVITVVAPTTEVVEEEDEDEMGVVGEEEASEAEEAPAAEE